MPETPTEEPAPPQPATDASADWSSGQPAQSPPQASPDWRSEQSADPSTWPPTNVEPQRPAAPVVQYQAEQTTQLAAPAPYGPQPAGAPQPGQFVPPPGYAAPLPAPGYAPAAYDTPAAPAKPLPKRHRLWFWTAMVLALAAIGTGGYFAVTTYQEAVAPETLVRNYLTALADGDAKAALSYAAPLPEASQLTTDPRALLTDDVLAAQLRVAPMTDVHIGDIDIDGDHATAHVSYTLGFDSGAQDIDDTFALVRDGREWQLATPAPKITLQLDRAGQRASFAGAKVPIGTYYVFPGAIPIDLDTDALQLTEDSRVVTFATADQIKVQDIELSEQGLADFSSAIDAALGQCLDGAATEPTLCPVPGDYRAVPGSMRGTLAGSSESQLEFKVQPGSDGNVLALGNLTIDGTYEQLDFNNRRVTKDVDDPVRVTVLANATDFGTLVWEFL